MGRDTPSRSIGPDDDLGKFGQEEPLSLAFVITGELLAGWKSDVEKKAGFSQQILSVDDELITLSI